MCILIKIGIYVINHDEWMNPTDFLGQRSKSIAKVGVDGDAKLCTVVVLLVIQYTVYRENFAPVLFSAISPSNPKANL